MSTPPLFPNKFAILASVLGVGKLTLAVFAATIPANDSVTYNFSNTGYRIYSIVNTAEGACALIALEWSKISIIWDGSNTIAENYTLSVSESTITITNKKSTSTPVRLY